MATKYTDAPLYQGKVNKSQLLKRIITDEMDEEGEVDAGKVLSVARTALLRYPTKNTSGVVIDRKDVHRIASLVREDYMKDDEVCAPADHGNWDAIKSVEEEVPTEENTLDDFRVYTDLQLLTAARLLFACGGDGQRARATLTMVSSIIVGREESREGQARPATEPGPS